MVEEEEEEEEAKEEPEERGWEKWEQREEKGGKQREGCRLKEQRKDKNDRNEDIDLTERGNRNRDEGNRNDRKIEILLVEPEEAGRGVRRGKLGGLLAACACAITFFFGNNFYIFWLLQCVAHIFFWQFLYFLEKTEREHPA